VSLPGDLIMRWYLYAHVCRNQPSKQQLANLPPNWGWTLYSKSEHAPYVIDLFEPQVLRDDAIFTEFPDGMLKIYQFTQNDNILKKVIVHLENQFTYAFTDYLQLIEANTTLSRTLDCEILSFNSTSGGGELIVLSEQGQIKHSKIYHENFIIDYTNDKLTVTYCQLDDEIDNQSNMDQWQIAIPGAEVDESNEECPNVVHSLVSNELQIFTGSQNLEVDVNFLVEENEFKDLQRITSYLDFPHASEIVHQNREKLYLTRFYRKNNIKSVLLIVIYLFSFFLANYYIEPDIAYLYFERTLVLSAFSVSIVNLCYFFKSLNASIVAAMIALMTMLLPIYHFTIAYSGSLVMGILYSFLILLPLLLILSFTVLLLNSELLGAIRQRYYRNGGK